MDRGYMADELDERIAAAIGLAAQYGMIDGAHHKQWVITEIVKVLIADEDTYKEWAKSDDPEYSDWDEGIAP